MSKSAKISFENGMERIAASLKNQGYTGTLQDLIASYRSVFGDQIPSPKSPIVRRRKPNHRLSFDFTSSIWMELVGGVLYIVGAEGSGRRSLGRALAQSAVSGATDVVFIDQDILATDFEMTESILASGRPVSKCSVTVKLHLCPLLQASDDNFISRLVSCLAHWRSRHACVAVLNGLSPDLERRLFHELKGKIQLMVFGDIHHINHEILDRSHIVAIMGQEGAADCLKALKHPDFFQKHYYEEYIRLKTAFPLVENAKSGIILSCQGALPIALHPDTGRLHLLKKIQAEQPHTA